MTTFSLPPVNITEDQCHQMQSLIGNQINEAYSNPDNMTPTMQNKLIAIALSVLSATAALFAAVTTYSFVAVILLAGSALGAYYVLTVKDYDNSEERDSYIHQIARNFLADIAKEHTPENVINYALLGDAEPRVYIAYQQLAAIYKSEEDRFNQRTNRIEADFDTQMAPARTRVDLAHQRNMVNAQSRENHPNPSTLRSALNTVVVAADTVNTVQAVQGQQRAQNAYAPERNANLSEARTEFFTNCSQINAAFEEFRRRIA